MNNNTATKKDIVKEIKTELEMRRRVWKRVPGAHDLFLDADHNRRYNVLCDLLAIVENMTDREFLTVQGRVGNLVTAINAQTKLEL